MNKNDILRIIVLAMSSLLLVLPNTSGLAPSGASISATGVVQYNNSSSKVGTPINKAVIAYTYFGYAPSTAADSAFAGNHFSLLDIYLDDTASALQSIKNANPNVKILGYKSLIAEHTVYDDWAIVNSNEAWFVHDANGNRIRSNQYGYYLMDVSSPGWRQHWVDYVNSKFNLPAGAYYDGVFVDDVYRALSSADYSSTIPSTVLSNWKPNCMEMLTYVKSKLPTGKLLFINTNEMLTDDYLNLPAVDGQMVEGYVHADWEPITTYSDAITWVQILARKSATNKTIWAASGTIASSSAAQMANMMKYCYASFLLGMNGTQTYWGFSGWGSSDGSNGYYSIMDTDIGQAIGAYYSSQSVYMRNFTLGKVLFNPSGNTRTVTLGVTYRLLNGTTVSNVTLNPYSGEVLSSPT